MDPGRSGVTPCALLSSGKDQLFSLVTNAPAGTEMRRFVESLRGTSRSADRNSSQTRRFLTLAGAGLIFASGLIHLVLTPEHLEEAAYLGLLFLADFAGAVVAAFGIYRGRRWGWVLGALVAAGAPVAYVISRTVGLPGMEPEGLLDPVGVVTKLTEALFLGLCVLALVIRTSPSDP